MYVHIGKEYILKSEKIITVLNLEEMQLEEILKTIHVDSYIDISDQNPKSFILTKEEDGKKKGYVTNISSITLAKRIQSGII